MLLLLKRLSRTKKKKKPVYYFNITKEYIYGKIQARPGDSTPIIARIIDRNRVVGIAYLKLKVFNQGSAGNIFVLTSRDLEELVKAGELIPGRRYHLELYVPTITEEEEGGKKKIVYA